MSCQPKARDALRSAARALRDEDGVVEVDVLEPADSHREKWTLEVVLEATDRVGPGVLGELVAEGLGVALPAQHQGAQPVLVATA